MPQSVQQISEESRSSSNEDQVKKQAALAGTHVESFDRLCQVIDNAADVTNRKVVKLSAVFSNSNQRSVKLKKKLKNCEAYKGLIGFVKRVDSTRS